MSIERKCYTCLRRYPEKLLQQHVSMKNGLPVYNAECAICALARRSRESGLPPDQKFAPHVAGAKAYEAAVKYLKQTKQDLKGVV